MKYNKGEYAMEQLSTILTIGTAPDGSLVVDYNGTNRPLMDFMSHIDDADQLRIEKAVQTALHSCAIPNETKKNTYDLLNIFYGGERVKRGGHVEDPQVKLYVLYPNEYRVFVIPTQIKCSVMQFFTELKTCIEILVASAPLPAKGKVLGENTERVLCFRS
jgi:hypothetical protein